jgi:flagellar biosynthetic protein FliO
MRSGRPRPCARLALAFALLLAGCSPLSAAAAAPFHRDETPLPAGVTGGSGGGGTGAAVETASSGSSAALRMLLGLAIVLAIIFALYKLLKRSASKNDKGVRAHGEMTVVASTPLAQSRALHLVRVGDELVLVGSSEQGVTPIRVYTAEEVRRLGFDPTASLPALAPAAGSGSSGFGSGFGFLPGSPSGSGSGPGGGFGPALLETLRKMTAR